jgi:hypothetical protein
MPMREMYSTSLNSAANYGANSTPDPVYGPCANCINHPVEFVANNCPGIEHGVELVSVDSFLLGVQHKAAEYQAQLHQVDLDKHKHCLSTDEQATPVAAFEKLQLHTPCSATVRRKRSPNPGPLLPPQSAQIRLCPCASSTEPSTESSLGRAQQ